MDSLDFDLHELILDQLASILSSDVDTTNEDVLRLANRCPELPTDKDPGIGKPQQSIDFITKSYRQNISALASFAAGTGNEAHVNKILPILLNYLKFFPNFSFEDDLQWKDFSPPDQLSDKIVSELLNIATKTTAYREKIFKDICSFLGRLAHLLKCGDAEYICTVVLPMLNGLFRAIQSSNFPWHCNEFESFAHQSQALVHNDCLQEIGKIIDTIAHSSDPAHVYIKKFLARYQSQGYPLSTNGIILGLTMVMRSMLTRAIFVLSHPDDAFGLMTFKDVWGIVVCNKVVISLPVTDYVKKALRRTYVMSLQYFAELSIILDKLVAQGNDCPPALYAREIMAASLDVAAMASVFLHEVDDELISKLTTSLFNVPQTPDVKVQAAALDSATLLALNFPQTTLNMIKTIRKFLTTPSTIFELAVVADKNLTILDYAIIRLAYCLKTVPQETSSVIYNMLTSLSTGGHERPPVQPASPKKTLAPINTLSPDQISIHSSISGISRNEEQRQQVCENLVCTVTGVGCILKDDNITELCVTMLRSRLRNHTPAVDALILEKFVDIALISSDKTFTEIVRKFSEISRQKISSDNKVITSAVLKCQMDLASRISARPEFYELYLLNILSLFVDKGVDIQQTIAKDGKFQVTSLIGEIGILLPVLKTLMSHNDFKVHVNASKELVSLFRDMWFHCVLYGFVSEESWMREWRDCLIEIAQKTPPLVQESATNYLEKDLEYNSVLVRGNSDQELTNVRNSLSSFLPNRAYDIRYFSFAEVTFLLSVYHIEIMRCQMGQCSFILRYFVNKGVNTSKLVGCMEEIGNKVIDVFIKECTSRAIAHTINENFRTQVRCLMIATCHRLEKVHQLAIKQLDSLMTAFPSLLCDKKLLFLLLELIGLVWQSCDNEYTNEYSPTYTFISVKVGVTLDLPDSYIYRREVLSQLCEHAKKWLSLAMTRAPLEIRGLLENYLAEYDTHHSDNPVHMGRSVAFEMAKGFSRNDYKSGIFPRIPTAVVDNASELIKDYTLRRYYYGQATGAHHWLVSDIDKADKHDISLAKINDDIVDAQTRKVHISLAHLEKRILNHHHVSIKELSSTLHLAAGLLVAFSKLDEDLVHFIVWIPVYLFSPDSIKLGTEIWNWIINEKPIFEHRIMVEIADGWSWSVRNHRGLFSSALNMKDPFVNKMQYAPTDKATRDKNYKLAKDIFEPHLVWIQFLSGRFQAFRYRSNELVYLYVRLFQMTFDNCEHHSNHSLSREGRFQILIIGFRILQSNRMEASIEHKFRLRIYKTAFSWFSLSPKWVYGGNKRAMFSEYKLLIEVHKLVENDKIELNEILSTTPKKYSQFGLSPLTTAQDKNRDEIVNQFRKLRSLLLLFLESEISNLATWCNPLNSPDTIKDTFVPSAEKGLTEEEWKAIIRHSWTISPSLAVQLATRFKLTNVQNEVHKILCNNSADAVRVADALPLLLGDKLNPNLTSQFKYLLYWAPVPPIAAASYFSTYNDHPLVLQYAMRVLEYHPVDVVFFYIPQIVQALRFDSLGYIERFILGAAKISQLFAHQIIWNMNANMYKDDESSVPDSLKPTLDRIIENIVKSLSGEDKDFYEREFNFFNDVTSISGKLKPYIKKTKSEKKAKIDEEMAKIKVDVGVYLPSNPDGKVVDIDYKSGRPLQSHAKSAIFKVGDDCRQDVLALQLIAIFKNIFTSVGLDLYLFPYRIVATSPGCGVIDVIPNSISRDQLGREKVNSLYDYFLTKYGGLDSVTFQKARNSFIQSLAAYSVVSFLLQIKDRHNGNIMLDDEGHIIHIDFGFILDIAPGGINFESSPFKLTTEMIQVMGGSADVQQFKWFSELCIKAYLAVRPYAENICQCVGLMLGSGLPCFKGETLKRLRERFQLDKTERRAADFMIVKIHQSFENKRTVWYDSFQKATNGKTLFKIIFTSFQVLLKTRNPVKKKHLSQPAFKSRSERHLEGIQSISPLESSCLDNFRNTGMFTANERLKSGKFIQKCRYSDENIKHNLGQKKIGVTFDKLDISHVSQPLPELI
ncbi:2360_t:CDS:10 [Dentiscutata erythropus]|uniref:1-phosphatidylinositol 4-kinase n=2 Tax=Dentiscutata TaxID=756610 RepID=A0A9N8W208_9GLOM|nr:2360_t:CDS:10 [Dentiscutata erythropus]